MRNEDTPNLTRIVYRILYAKSSLKLGSEEEILSKFYTQRIRLIISNIIRVKWDGMAGIPLKIEARGTPAVSNERIEKAAACPGDLPWVASANTEGRDPGDGKGIIPISCVAQITSPTALNSHPSSGK